MQSYAEKTTSKVSLSNLTEDQQICLEALHIRTTFQLPHPARKREQRRADVLGLPPPDKPPQIYSSYHHQDHHHCLRCPPWEQSKHNPLFPFPATAELPKINCLNAFSKQAAVRCPSPSTLIRLRKVTDLKHKQTLSLRTGKGSKSPRM